jgi:hypothetical protein
LIGPNRHIAPFSRNLSLAFFSPSSSLVSLSPSSTYCIDHQYMHTVSPKNDCSFCLRPAEVHDSIDREYMCD